MSERYNMIITDDNFDVQFEAICDLLGIPYGTEAEFVDELPEGFSYNNPEDEKDSDYICTKSMLNIAVDCGSAIEEHKLAYAFANGYMILSDRSSMFD